MSVAPHVLAELERQAQSGDARAQYVLFAVHGQAGRKAEARAWLAKAVAAGNHDALYSKACLLLDGVDGPRDIPQAVEMLRETAELGGAAALRTMAVLTVLGQNGEPDPSLGLRYLRRASSLGDISAHQQVTLIDNGAFDRPVPQRVELSRSPNAWRIDELLPVEVCNYLVEAVKPLLHPSFVIDPRTGETLRSELRTSNTATVHPFRQDFVMHLINQRLSDAAQLTLQQGEMLSVLMYRVGQQYHPHFDFLDPTAGASTQFGSAGQRIATLLVSLNEGFAGGETHFLSNQLSYRGKTGDALLFWNVDREGKPDLSTRHAGNPVTSGVKFIISKWFREKPVAF